MTDYSNQIIEAHQAEMLEKFEKIIAENGSEQIEVLSVEETPAPWLNS